MAKSHPAPDLDHMASLLPKTTTDLREAVLCCFGIYLAFLALATPSRKRRAKQGVGTRGERSRG